MVDGPAAASLGRLARERWRRLAPGTCRRSARRRTIVWPARIEPDLTDVRRRDRPHHAGVGDRGQKSANARRCFIDSIAAASAIDLHREPVLHERRDRRSARTPAGRARRTRSDRGGQPQRMPRLARAQHDRATARGRCSGDCWPRTHTSVCASCIPPRHGRARCADVRALESHDRGRHVRADRIGQLLESIDGHGYRMRSRRRAAGDARARAGIAHIRDRLVAEHLGLESPRSRPRSRATASLTAFIDAHAGRDRTLARIEVADERGDRRDRGHSEPRSIPVSRSGSARRSID